MTAGSAFGQKLGLEGARAPGDAGGERVDVAALDGGHEDDAAPVDVQVVLCDNALRDVEPVCRRPDRPRPRDGGAVVVDVDPSSPLPHPYDHRLAVRVHESTVEHPLAHVVSVTSRTGFARASAGFRARQCLTPLPLLASAASFEKVSDTLSHPDAGPGRGMGVRHQPRLGENRRVNVIPIPGLEHLPFAEVWFHEIDEVRWREASAAARALGKTGLEAWTTDRTPEVVAFLQ